VGPRGVGFAWFAMRLHGSPGKSPWYAMRLHG
jgi:hypothetical protein